MQANQKDNTSVVLPEDMSLDCDVEQIEEIIPYSYYYENVFSLEDLYLFRAIYNFYLKDYTQAIADYEYCQNLKLEDFAPHSKKPANNRQPTP